MFKRILSFVLALVLAAASVPVLPAQAEQIGETQPLVIQESAPEESTLLTEETLAPVPESASPEETPLDTTPVTESTETEPEPGEPSAQPSQETTVSTEPELTEPEETADFTEPTLESASSPAAMASPTSGTCGVNLTWELDEEGTLTISGTGKMKNYMKFDPYGSDDQYAPWFNLRSNIKKIVMEEGITQIGSAAFYWVRFQPELVIPSTVTHVESYAFYGYDLEGIRFLGNAPTFQSQAFAGVEGKIYYPALDPTWTEDQMLSYGGAVSWIPVYPEDLPTSGAIDGLTWSVDDAGTLTIGGSGPIPDYTAFDLGDLSAAPPWYPLSYKIQNIVLEEGITATGDYAFYRFPLPETLTIPASVTSIGSGAFYGTKIFSLKALYFRGDMPQLKEDSFANYYGAVCYPYGNDTWTEDRMLPYDDVKWVLHKEIPADALASGTCGTYLRWWVDTEGTLTINGYGNMTNYSYSSAPFSQYSSSILKIVIDRGVTTIGYNAFDACQSAVEVSIADTVTQIGKEAFYGMNITSLTIPGSVTTIGYSAFQYCIYLKTLTLGEGVKQIQSSAFRSCERLGSLTIPKSVTAIEVSAFANSGIKQLIFLGDAPSISSTAFRYITAAAYYLEGNTTWNETTMQDYGGSLTWTQMNPDLVQMGICGGPAWELYENGTLRILGSGKMEDYHKNNLPPWDAYDASIRRVIVEENVTGLGDFAFDGCYELAEVSLPQGILDLGMATFQNCTSLKEIRIPDSITEIEEHLFSGCSGLRTITIPSGVRNIRSYAFHETHLSDIYFDGSAMLWTIISLGGGNDSLDIEDIHFGGFYPEAPGEMIRDKEGIFFYGTDGDDDERAENKRYIFSGYDEAWFASSTTLYKHDLAKMSIRGAMAAFGTSTGKTNAYRGRNISQLMTDLGFVNQHLCYPVPESDSIGYAIGSKNIAYPTGDFSLIMLTVRGGGYGTEWGGNFRMGTDGVNHEGFDVAAEEVLWGLETYLKENSQYLQSNIKIWIMGYSRAGATSNLLAAKLNQGAIAGIDSTDVYAYCFECPKGTTDPDAHSSDYNNIFSIVNPIDIVPMVAMEEPGFDFTRYGVTYYTPGAYFNSRYYADKKPAANNVYSHILRMNNTGMSELSSIVTAENQMLESQFQTFVLESLLKSLSDLLISREWYQDSGLEDFVITQAATRLGNGKLSFSAKKDPNLEGFLNEVVKVIAQNKLDDSIQGAILGKADDFLSWFKLALTSTTILYVGRAHYPELCLSWVDSCGGELLYSPKYKRLLVNCPVDVSVYDSEGKLVARFIDDVPQEIANGLPSYVDLNGQKIVCMPTDGDYRVEVVATGEGSLTYSVTEEAYDSGTTEKVVGFLEVPITSGDQLTGTVAGAGASAPTLAKNDVALKPDVVQEGSAIQTWTVTAAAETGGQAYGSGSFLTGEFAKVTATVDRGYRFEGWYDAQGNCLSEALAYRFCVMENTVLTARFIQQPIYPVTSPADSWIWGEMTDLCFAVEAEGDGLQTLEVDGKLLDSRHYRWQNNTLTIPRETLLDHTAGEHALYLQFENGCAMTSFRVIPQLAIGAESNELLWGSAMELTPRIYPSDTEEPEYVWYLPEEFAPYATLTQTGLLTAAQGQGNVTIYVELRAKDDSCAPSRQEISITPNIQILDSKGQSPAWELVCGKSASYSLLDGASGKRFPAKQVQWSLRPQDLAVASVTSAGKLTTKTVYERVTIMLTARVGDLWKSLPVTILPKTTQLNLMMGDETVSGHVIPLAPRANIFLYTQACPEDAMWERAWTSSNPKIATVEDGWVTAVSPGSATITVKTLDGTNKKATVKIEVGTMVDTVTITAPEPSLRSGKSLKLTAVTAPVTKSVLWTVDDPLIASISSSGVLKAKTIYEPATVTVTAVAKDALGVSGSCQVTLLPKDDNVLVIRQDGRNVTAAAIACELADSVQLKAFTGTQEETVQWKSSSPRTVDVTQDGSLILHKTGKATITATSGKRTAKVTVQVSTHVSAITVVGENTLAAGKTLKLAAQVLPADASNKSLTWEITEGSQWATLTAAGVLKASSNLTQEVQVFLRAAAKDGSGVVSDPFPVTLRPGATGVVLYNGSHIADAQKTWDAADGTLTLSAKVYPSQAKNSVLWTSSSEKIATVSETGVVTPLKPGTVTITATASDGSRQKDSIKLTITKRITGLSMDPQVLASGKSLKLTDALKILPLDTTTKTLVWELAEQQDAEFVSLSSKGVLKAKKVETPYPVKILVTAQDTGAAQGECIVTLYPNAVQSLRLRQEDRDITGKTITLGTAMTAQLTPVITADEPNTAKQVFWSSSKPLVASVDSSGRITAHSPGSASITCTAADGSRKKATVKVTVVPEASILTLSSSRMEAFSIGTANHGSSY